MAKQLRTKIIKTGVFYRMTDGGVNVRDVDEEKRTVELSFSSEEPVDRYFGKEILDHDKKSVDLSFLNSGRAPLLKDHYTFEQTGVIESAKVGTDRMGRAIVRFGKSQLADDEFNDVKDEIRSNVSVGYRIKKMILEEQSEDDGDIYRVVDWEPLEISIVSIPADQSVGVGRAAKDEREFETTVIEEREEIMPKENKNTPDPVITRSVSQPAPVEVDVEKITAKTRKAETYRVKEIMALGAARGFEKEALTAIDDGTSVDQFRQFILEKIPGVTPISEPDPDIGLTKKEADNFSFLRAINALANPGERSAQEAAGFEIEVSQAFADRVKRTSRGLFVPPDVLKRDLNIGVDAEGGHLVGTDIRPQNFIEALRNKIVLEAAGATVITDLIGDIAIPKQSGGATAYWVAESGAPTESQQTIGQLALAPKTVAAFTDMSRKLIIQSSIDVEAFVRNDLARVIAIALDTAGMHGTGAANQPTGIAATTGIGSVAGGANGLAPNEDHIIDLETEVAQDNADVGALSYISNTKVRGKLKKTLITETYGDLKVWDRNSNTPLNGYPAHISNSVSSTLDKGTSTGVCSAIFFGNWADLVIALWSGLDLLVDPYTGSTSGTVRVTAFQDADIGVRHAESFAAMLDALTA